MSRRELYKGKVHIKPYNIDVEKATILIDLVYKKSTICSIIVLQDYVNKTWGYELTEKDACDFYDDAKKLALYPYKL